MGRLIEAIGPGPVALDSSIFIYFIERHVRYVSILRPIFQRLTEAKLLAVTSTLTLLETLVGPYQTGDVDLAGQYEAILTDSPSLTLVPIDSQLLRSAAKIRAVTSARTPDALQLASAMAEHCTMLLTNDHRIRSLPGLEVLQLDDFTSA